MSTLKERVRALVTAEAAVVSELERLYPIGKPVRVWLMSGQVTPSRGEVIGHDGGRHAYVRVRLESRTREVRTIAASNIIGAK